MRKLLLLTVAVVATANLAHAQSGDDAIMRSLIRKLERNGKIDNDLDRGLRLPREGSAAPGPTVALPAPVAAPAIVRTASAATRVPVRETTSDAPSASITVNFARASAVLTPQAQAALVPLGRALRSPELARDRFRIEGHTDTEGDAGINQALSTQRALAVKEYLVREWNLGPDRLEAIGLGDKQLLVNTPGNTPEARNRRVQVVNVGS